MPILHNRPSSLSVCVCFFTFSLFFSGLLVVFPGGRKWATLFHLQSPASHRLLPWLHFALPPNFWSRCECQNFLVSVLVLDSLGALLNLVFICPFPCFFPLLCWPVSGVDAGGSKHQTEQLDCPWNSRNRCCHLRYHGRRLSCPFMAIIYHKLSGI